MSQQSLVEDIRATLLADTTVAGLVAKRVYPDVATQGAVLPYLIYQEVSLAGWYQLGGPAGVRTARLQFDAYSQSKTETRTLMEALLALFDGRKQTLNARTEVLTATISGGGTGFDPDERVYRYRVDLSFIYRA